MFYEEIEERELNDPFESFTDEEWEKHFEAKRREIVRDLLKGLTVKLLTVISDEGTMSIQFPSSEVVETPFGGSFCIPWLPNLKIELLRDELGNTSYKPTYFFEGVFGKKGNYDAETSDLHSND